MSETVLKGLVMCGKLLFRYAINRLREPSTWQGINVVTTAAGVSISPEMTSQIVALGVAAAGVIHAVFPEKSQ